MFEVKPVPPVPPFAVPKMPARVIVPEVVTGPPEVVRPVVPPETSIDVTVPAPLPTQIPLIAKQPPAAKLIPPLVVLKVEVPEVKLIPFVFPIESSVPAEVVPMPSLPEKYPSEIFGSKKNFAEVVAEAPMTTMSLVLFG